VIAPTSGVNAYLPLPAITKKPVSDTAQEAGK